MISPNSSRSLCHVISLNMHILQQHWSPVVVIWWGHSSSMLLSFIFTSNENLNQRSDELQQRWTCSSIHAALQTNTHICYMITASSRFSAICEQNTSSNSPNRTWHVSFDFSGYFGHLECFDAAETSSFSNIGQPRRFEGLAHCNKVCMGRSGVPW